MLKRYGIKYVRDRAKARYKKGSECRICRKTESLDFHHFCTVSILVHNYMAEKGLAEEDVLDWRDDFIASHEDELYSSDKTVTLCHDHHLQLHSIYGTNPLLHTAKKQSRWVEIQREKHGN